MDENNNHVGTQSWDNVLDGSASSSGNVDVDQVGIRSKIKILFQTVAWIVAFLMILSYNVPGIVIAIQYSNDPCVDKNISNFSIDIWLLVACSYTILYMFLALITICAEIRKCLFTTFYFFTHLIPITWIGIGIYLLIISSLECEHNSVWAMSLSWIIITSIIGVLEYILLFGNCCRCWPSFNRLQSNLQSNSSDSTYYFDLV